MADLQQVERLAKRLMKKHGLADWKFKLGNARQRLGTCSYRTNTIIISRHHVAQHTPAQVRDSILHEIAHALLPEHVNHGQEWKELAQRIGAKPTTGGDYSPIKGGWTVTCVGCGKTWDGWYSRREMRCKKHPAILLEWTNTDTGKAWRTGTIPEWEAHKAAVAALAEC